MSIKVIKFVFRLRITPTRKLVLLAIAEHAHDDGTGAWPSVATLADETGLNRATVQRGLRWLEEAGFLVTESRDGGSNRYALWMGTNLPHSAAPACRTVRPPLPQGAAQIVIEPSVEPKEAEPPAQQAIPGTPELSAAQLVHQELTTVNQRANLIARECLDRYPFNVFHGVRTAVGAALKGGVPDDDVRRALKALCARDDPVSVNALKVELNGGFTQRPRTYDDPGTHNYDTSMPREHDVFRSPEGVAPNDAYRAARNAARRPA